MLAPAAALERILARARVVAPLPAERVALDEALGRVLASALVAPRPLPPFAAATMDGYAFRASDALRRGARLPVAGEVAAGHPAKVPLPKGSCVRIYTGAPLPRGADCVEMQEEVRRDGAVAVLARVGERGRFIRPPGSDVARGAVALPAGAELDPGAIGLAASLGRTWVAVHRRPRVAILPTGDEVVPLGTRPGLGQIVESNAHALAAAVREAGGLPTILPIARDDRRALRRALALARGADVLLTSGGVSVGERDLVQAALREAGATLDFWKVAMRPGKPLLFGRLGRTLVLGLPGNPASALVTFELFGRPALRTLAGLPCPGRVLARGRLSAPVEKPSGLTVYLRVTARTRGGLLELVPLRTQVSGHSTSSALIGALAILPSGRGRFSRGARVDAILLRVPET